MKTNPYVSKAAALLFCFQFSVSLVSAFTLNTESGFIELVDLQHACESQLGSITVTLEGNPDDYTYFWKHGSTDLTITDLVPEIYVFTAIDKYGCIEECAFEILLSESCELEFTMNEGRNACEVDVALSLLDSVSGVAFAESALEVKWADDYPGGLNRTFSKEMGGTFCFTVTLKSENGGCCSKEDCVVIPTDSSCDALTDTKIIVNEYHRTGLGEKQFVELLVRGDGTCEGVMDIRGFHLDDNNGALVSANATAAATMPNLVGIDPGFLTFAYDNAWTAVPHGSLIVIYDETTSSTDWLLPDDPYDGNQDGVYVLPADHSLLFGQQNSYDPSTEEWPYTGMVASPSWSHISLSKQVDGMQVRHPDGYLSHGISAGNSAYADSLVYPLHLSTLSNTDMSARWVDQDPLNKAHYLVSETDPTTISLGLPNSTENANYIQDLKVCSMAQLSLQGAPTNLEESVNLEKNDRDQSTWAGPQPQIQAYPNPFYRQINVVISTELQGEALVLIHDMKGQLLFQQLIALNGAASQETALDLGQALPVGVHILSCQFPTGGVQRLRLVRIE
ncbi:MAG: T9SS type A sorting domain-containing protein [Bacteroidota bacterium]